VRLGPARPILDDALFRIAYAAPCNDPQAGPWRAVVLATFLPVRQSRKPESSREGAIDSRVAGVITLLGQQQPIQPYRGLDYNGRGVDSTRLLSR
jgi:hypothetical protein